MRFHDSVSRTLTTGATKFALWVIPLALLGCAAPYREPATGPKASIKFVNDGKDKMSVHFHEDAAECTNRTSTGLIEPKSSRSIAVPAEKEVVLTTGMDPGDRMLIAIAVGGAVGAALMPSFKGCTPTVEFIPEAGMSYVFRMNSDGSDCTHQFYAVSPSAQGPDEVRPVQFVPREWIRAFGESGPWCKKKNG
ncbi:hypothetical protein J2W28_003218 [Variovorax boronicumulans]|uniref:hypothetical protein n=1 Tax=Variovorax boronicumulans TaxID=436515 RepID=UPI0027893E75|nr:hypothetical protein [Variovorax boronicumulans]MDP9992842.1 hypothetical protein [Variovorax boronicumulans]MDQ0004067.1 hypothetical protein [Variovorax boronicumulans]